MTDFAALTSDHVTAVGLGTIAVILLIGLLVAVVVARFVVRVITLVVVVALVALVWTQRTAVVDGVQDAARRCEVSFFGIHVDPSNEAVRQACADVSGS